MKTEIMEVCNQEMEKKEGKNKGFSLVELIVVIAIMAILAVVIAPQVMKYIGKSKDSVDAANMALYKTAITTALSDETAYSEISGTKANCTIKIQMNSTSKKVEASGYPTGTTTFKSEFENVLADGMKLPQEPNKNTFVITIAVDSTGKIGKISVESTKE